MDESPAVAHRSKLSAGRASHVPTPDPIASNTLTAQNQKLQPSLFRYDSGKLLATSVHGSETSSVQRGASFDYPDNCSLSCPERLHVPGNSPEATPSDRSHRSLSQRLLFSLSQPASSNSLRSRLASRFSRRPPWRSSPGSSLSNIPSSPRQEVGSDQAKFPVGKERRRRARESERRRRSSDDELLELQGEEGTWPLAMAAVALATTDLDRLSSMAKTGEKVSVDDKEAGETF